MRISGTDISPFNIFRFKFKPETQIALKWVKKSNNNWIALDRGITNDIYKTEISFYGRESDINKIVDELEANRWGGTNYFSVSQFNGVDDQIFGADIDYTSNLDITVLKWKKRKQKQFKSFSLNLLIQLIENPYLYSGTPSLQILRPLIGYIGDSSNEIKKLFTYDNNFSYIDHEKDAGFFEGSFLMSQSEMKSFRRYLMLTIRGNNMVISNMLGVAYPFGSKRSSGFPVTVKVLDFQDELLNINFWILKLKLAEVI